LNSPHIYRKLSLTKFLQINMSGQIITGVHEDSRKKKNEPCYLIT
jgi:hypothetical protein